MENTPMKYEEMGVQAGSPASLIHAAISGGADLDKLEKLMLLQERFEANEAKKAYVVAMAEFKADPPRIEKTKQVKFSSTEYKHALLADVAEKINRALSMHGLSASWRTTQSEKGITVTCTITHNMGYSESTELTAAPDTSGAKNAIQAIGSTVSYLERYTILALTGLASHDMDDDGGGVKYITEEQQNVLHSLMVDHGLKDELPKLLTYMKVDAISSISEKDFKKARSAIQAKINASKKEAAK